MAPMHVCMCGCNQEIRRDRVFSDGDHRTAWIANGGNWFEEPTEEDDTIAHRGESPFEWLNRSTWARARETRRFLNHNLFALPLDAQEPIYLGLKHRWHTAFFELVVGRIVQELGAQVEMEATNSDGHRPDFVARFPDVNVIIEATVPAINPEAGDVLKRRNPLLDLIEARIPEGWQLGVWQLPDIPLSNSRREFIRTVEKMLDVRPPDESAQDLVLTADISTGRIQLHLWPAHAQSERLQVEPAFTVWDNTEARIRRAVSVKKRQVRNSEMPVLLAIQAAGIASNFDGFDCALFGRSYEAYDVHRRFAGVGFTPDGAFNNNRSEAPTYAGVLAFTEVGFRAFPPPRLYRHPRFQGTLPKSLSALEQCWFDIAAGEIRRRPALETEYLERLSFLPPGI